MRHTRRPYLVPGTVFPVAPDHFGMTTVSAVAESNDDGAMLFAFAFPGASGWGPTEVDARERLRLSLRRTTDWLDRHDLTHLAPAIDPFQADIDITERVPATSDPLAFDSEGFFAYDTEAYTDEEVARTRTLLGCSRADLRNLLDGLTTAQRDHRLVEDRRTIREIVDHVAIAEHWYLTRVEVPVEIPATWRDYPDETFERLAATRADVELVLDALPAVSADRRTLTWTIDGERWSYRKLLRRLFWHERLHTDQLERLIPKVDAAIE